MELCASNHFIYFVQVSRKNTLSYKEIILHPAPQIFEPVLIDNIKKTTNLCLCTPPVGFQS